MKPILDLISIVTSQSKAMKHFYTDTLGFKIMLDLENYCEFENQGVRFAITTHKVMSDATQHPSFSKKREGQSFELAFKVPTSEEVDDVYQEWVRKGAQPIQEPETMPWNQRTAFFADPDGNIHEIFADLPK
jgi:lactoylglutathione lyase